MTLGLDQEVENGLICISSSRPPSPKKSDREIDSEAAGAEGRGGPLEELVDDLIVIGHERKTHGRDFIDAGEHAELVKIMQ